MKKIAIVFAAVAAFTIPACSEDNACAGLNEAMGDQDQLAEDLKDPASAPWIDQMRDCYEQERG